MPPTATLINGIESIPRRELYFFALYRLLIASVIAGLMFSPLSSLVGQADKPQLALTTSAGYFALSVLMLVLGRSEHWLRSIVVVGVGIDIVAACLLAHALPGASAGLSVSLLFNVAAAATLLPLSMGMLLAVVASLATAVGYAWKLAEGGDPARSLAELAMFATSYLAVAYISSEVAQRARRNQQLANERGDEVANLYEINELIIRRLRTGVLVVDADNRISVANEAASRLLGDGDGHSDSGRLLLDSASPALARRLLRWRNGWEHEESPLQLLPELPEVQPRFARLRADSELTLVFLDDTSVVSRRAESLTLSTMGRFSASLAHEIRNPLAAISYAVQLLEEEGQRFDEADRRLLQIIRQQCLRTNGIVESVLGLARRERANPENVELGGFVQRFVDEYRQGLSLETDRLEAGVTSPAAAQVDPRHLHQVLSTLVHNALKYGRVGVQPAQVRLHVYRHDRSAIIEVTDRGPGIPDSVVPQLFRPFFTTSEHGTGLGLYIARELCRANQARLDYVPLPAGGACFRLTLPGPHTLFTPRAP